MRLSYYCTSSWANYFLESLSGSTCFHFVMRPIVHMSWEEPLSIAAVVRKSIQQVLFSISRKDVCLSPSLPRCSHGWSLDMRGSSALDISPDPVPWWWGCWDDRSSGSSHSSVIPLTLTRVPQHQLLLPPIQFSSKSPLVFYLHIF